MSERFETSLDMVFEFFGIGELKGPVGIDGRKDIVAAHNEDLLRYRNVVEALPEIENTLHLAKEHLPGGHNSLRGMAIRDIDTIQRLLKELKDDSL